MRAVKGRKLDEEEGGILISTNNSFQTPAPNLALLCLSWTFMAPFCLLYWKMWWIVLFCDVFYFGFFLST